MTETGGQLLQRLGDDAAKWAAEFRQTAIRLGYSDMDEGWLIGWFANAIENAEIVRRERTAPRPPQRAHELICSIGADSKDALARRIYDFADRIERDEITHGCSGGHDSGTIYSYKHDPAMTHDRYFEDLKAHLDRTPALTQPQHGTET